MLAAITFLIATLGVGEPADDLAVAMTAPPTEEIAISAEDGAAIHGTYYPAYNARGLVLLFHQANASHGEYASVAPKLAAAGYSALAIDQRSGGEMFGHNETVAELGRSSAYLDARQDLEAALAWSHRMELPTFLVGSSYSSGLVLMVAADHPNEVAGVASFSPGEYFGAADLVANAAARVSAPTLIVTTAEEGERVRAAPIVAALQQSGVKLEYDAILHGQHGAATLIQNISPESGTKSLAVLIRWLLRYTGPASPA